MTMMIGNPEMGSLPPGATEPTPEQTPRPDRRELAERKRQIIAWGDITPADRVILETPIFTTGNIVSVRRSPKNKGEEGVVEPGWEVMDTDLATGKVRVIKKVGEHLLEKRVKEEELVELNP